MILCCTHFFTGDRVRSNSRSRTSKDSTEEASVADSDSTEDKYIQRKKKQRLHSQKSPDASIEASIADSSDDDCKQRKNKERHHAYFSKHQRSNIPLINDEEDYASHSQREKSRSKVIASVSSKSSNTKSSSLSSKPKKVGEDSNENIYDGTNDDRRNWQDFLKETAVNLFRKKFIDVSTICFISLNYISTNVTQIVCKLITKSLKPNEKLKEYKSYNNVIAITVLRAIVLHYKKYAEESYLELTEEEDSYLDSLYEGSKPSKQMVSF